MGGKVDYYISAVRVKGNHVTHVRVHKALANGAFAPYGLVQPRSTVIMNLRSNAQAYKTLILEGSRGQPGDTVRLAEIDKRFYLRTASDDIAHDDLGSLPHF